MRVFQKSLSISGVKNIFPSSRFINLSLPRFFTTGSNKDSSSSNPTSSSSNQSPSQPDKKQSGQTSQSGGISEQMRQSYVQDPQGTMDYMKTQYQEGFGPTIENLILQDHNVIRTVYEKFKSATSREEAEKWRNEFVYEIARHSIAEEVVLYPLMRSYFPDGENLFQTSIKEHHKVKEDLYKAEHADPYSDNFRSKVKDVMDDLIKHIQKEEKEILPMVRKYLNEDQRTKAAKAFSFKKLIVPTRPHTMVPEDPVTINNILGLLTSPIDKFRDLFTAFPDQHKMSEIKKEASSNASSSSTSKNVDSGSQSRSSSSTNTNRH
jgi:hemerythrin superfamily protein